MTSRSLKKRRTTARWTTRTTTALSLAALLLTAAAGPAQTPGPFPPAAGPVPVTLPAAQNPRPRPQVVAADATPSAVLPTPPQTKVMVFEKNAGSDAPTPMGSGVPLPVLAVPQVPDGPVPDKKDTKGLLPKADPKLAKDPDKEPDKPMVPPAEESPCLPQRKPFKLESEGELLKRVTKELIEEERVREERAKKSDWRPNEAYYQPPPVARLIGCEGPHVPKTVGYPPYTKYIEPGYVVHRKLHFEDPNSERHGWELGLAQPMVSTLYFYKDVLLWPASLTSNLRERYDTSAGKCPPGSPYPYSLYPPGYSLFGLSTEASLLVGAAFIFP